VAYGNFMPQPRPQLLSTAAELSTPESVARKLFDARRAERFAATSSRSMPWLATFRAP